MAAYSRCALGQARAQLGRATEGVALIRRGIADLLEIGTRLRLSDHITCLAAAQEREGTIVEALATVERALQANPDEVVYRPEALRLRGELRLKKGKTEQAETDFHEAIALAQRMSAKVWELRATMSLARLLAKQGRGDEARTMLAEIYGRFTEGFDTLDLKEAKALLNELGE
jgi:predicted ATPase